MFFLGVACLISIVLMLCGNNKQLQTFLLFAIIIVVLPFRNFFGYDFDYYFSLYDQLECSFVFDNESIEGSFAKEPLFRLIILFCKRIGLNYCCFLVFIGVVTVLISYLSIIKIDQENASMLLGFMFLLGFVYLVYGQIRQALAVPILIYASSFIMREKKYYVFFSLVLVSSLIHWSSVVFFVFPFVVYIKKWTLLLGVSFVFVLVIYLLLEFVEIEFIQQKLNHYIDFRRPLRYEVIKIFDKIILLIWFVFIVDKSNVDQSIYNIVMFSFVLYFCLVLIIPEVVARLVFPFFVFFIFLVPRMTYRNRCFFIGYLCVRFFVKQIYM